MEQHNSAEGKPGNDKNEVTCYTESLPPAAILTKGLAKDGGALKAIACWLPMQCTLKISILVYSWAPTYRRRSLANFEWHLVLLQWSGC